jgi:hypothetical protein
VYLKVGLAALLVFAGAKILVGIVYEIPIAVSLAVIGLILATAVVSSLIATMPDRARLQGPAVRIGAGVGLGLLGLGFVALAAAVRDGSGLVVIEIGALLAASLSVVAGSMALRRLHARRQLERVWAVVGIALLLGLTLVVAID